MLQYRSFVDPQDSLGTKTSTVPQMKSYFMNLVEPMINTTNEIDVCTQVSYLLIVQFVKAIMLY